MKIRSGFVSNSSSSSFLCCVCGEVFSGWDGMYDGGIEERECLNGHTFCSDHIISVELTNEEEEECWDGNVHRKECPICAMQQTLDNELLYYLLKRDGASKKELVEEIKDKFPNYKDFKAYITDE